MPTAASNAHPESSTTMATTVGSHESRRTKKPKASAALSPATPPTCSASCCSRYRSPRPGSSSTPRAPWRCPAPSRRRGRAPQVRAAQHARRAGRDCSSMTRGGAEPGSAADSSCTSCGAEGHPAARKDARTPCPVPATARRALHGERAGATTSYEQEAEAAPLPTAVAGVRERSSRSSATTVNLRPLPGRPRTG